MTNDINIATSINEYTIVIDDYLFADDINIATSINEYTIVNDSYLFVDDDSDIDGGAPNTVF